MSAGAVLYVGNFGLMRSFYEQCFGLAAADAAADFCQLAAGAWVLTLVRSADAVPATSPPIRRAQTPVKLAFAVSSIAAVRTVIAELGGQVDPTETEWEFQGATRCDALDPEGNVVQLVAPRDRAAD